jgi:Arc/MetJ-type ribon-helix-helix transcriptional regulator
LSLGGAGEIMPKVRRSVTLSEETMAWIKDQIKKKRFKDVSHALEYAIYQLMQEDKDKE